MNITNEIIEASKILNEVDEYINTLSDSLTNVNHKIQDLMHLIEYNNLKTNQCYRVIKELHKLRLERRKIKNDIEIANTLKSHKNKLINKDNRQFLIDLIIKAEKSVTTSIYKNRIYTDDELEELIGV